MRLTGSAKLVLVVSTLLVLFSPGIRHHWNIAHDPYFVPFDAVLYIPPFFKFDAKDPIPTTYLKEFRLDAMSPPLYKASLAFGARFMDVRQLHLVLMYLAYGFFVAILGRLGWLLGGATLSFAVMAFTITAWIFIGLGFIGGAPRMYAYPLMAVILFALVRDQPKTLGLTAILGAFLYPIVAPVAGLCLFGWLTLPLYTRQGVVSGWSLPRRLVTLGLFGIITASALIPMIIGGSAYGRRMVAADIVEYPEAGPGGNLRDYDQLPYQLFGKEWLSYYLGPMYSHGDAFVPWLNAHKILDPVSLLATLALCGLITLIIVSAGLRLALQNDDRAVALRVIGFFVAAVVMHVIAWLAAPYIYIPTRYFMFSLPFVITLLFPWSIQLLIGRLRPLKSSPALRSTVFLAIAAVYLILFGGRGNVDFEKATIVANSTRPLMKTLAALPKNIVVAGWPFGEMKNLEYITRRNAFLTAELHEIHYLEYVQNMHKRMDAVFDAYFSTDSAPLRRLRDEFGVTHFIVESRHFTDPDKPPEYFSPWGARIVPRLEAIRDKAYVMNKAVQEQSAIFDGNGFTLLDLARLP